MRVSEHVPASAPHTYDITGLTAPQYKAVRAALHAIQVGNFDLRGTIRSDAATVARYLRGIGPTFKYEGGTF